MKSPLVLGLCVWATLSSANALADRAACFDAASEGQTLRDEHKLIEARDKFRVCAQEECPVAMQSDCAQWLEAADRSIATVVLSATDASGASVFEVNVSVDGQPLMTRLDGRAVSINPGLHTFRFEGSDGTSVEQTAQANEGDKNQKIAVVLRRMTSLPAPLPTPTPRPGLRTRKTIGLAAGGAGLAAIVLGGVFGGLAASEVDEQKSDCSPSSCTTSGHTLALSEHSMAITDGAVSTVAFVAGGALVLGGALLFFVPGHAVAVSPAVGSGRGLSLRGEF